MCIHLDTCKFDLATPVVYLYTICINRIISYIFIHMCMKWDPHLWEKTCLHMKRHLYLAKDTYLKKETQIYEKRLKFDGKNRVCAASGDFVCSTRACTHARTPTHTNTHPLVQEDTLADTHTRSLYIHVYIWIYIYIHIRSVPQTAHEIHMRTYIYIYTHAHVRC